MSHVMSCHVILYQSGVVRSGQVRSGQVKLHELSVSNLNSLLQSQASSARRQASGPAERAPRADLTVFQLLARPVLGRRDYLEAVADCLERCEGILSLGNNLRDEVTRHGEEEQRKEGLHKGRTLDG